MSRDRDESPGAPLDAEGMSPGAQLTASQMFRVVPSAIFTVDLEKRVTSVNDNALEILGYEREELVGESCEKFAVTPCRGECGLLADDVRKPVHGLECSVLTKDGRELTVLKNVDALRDAAGRVTGGIESFIDITDRKRAEEEARAARLAAEEATRAKSDFLANMSHEIRTPMNAVIGMTGLLLGTDLDREQREFVETIRKSGGDLLALINDLLDFSKIESGELRLEEQPFDLRACVEQAVDLLAAPAAEKGLDLAYEIRDGTPEWLRGDPTRIRQVLVNLLANAVKFTERGEVFVSVESSPVAESRHEVRFAVRDTGIGIPKERLDRLFRSFTQVDGSATRQFGGTGLGLSVSRKLVRLMDGDMRVESEPEVGSTFHFSVTAQPARGVTREFPLSVHPVLEGMKLLVVDDNATSRGIVGRLAASWGMVPRPAASGPEALEMIRFGEPFDAAILDLRMPEMDGVTLARAIRQHRDPDALPLILLSSVGRPDEDGEDAGPDPRFAAFLSKPVKPTQLFETLMDVLADRRSAGAPASDAERLADRLPLRILLVEDNVVNQKVALKMLERLGYRADLAADGVEALEAVERQRYDVVIMDVQMPRMDGLAATAAIRREVPAEEQPRIVAMTANAMDGDREMCLDAGMDDYVSKPVRMKALVSALERSAGEAPSPVAEPTDGPRESGATVDFEVLRDYAGHDESLAAELLDLFARDVPDLLLAMREGIEAEDAEGFGRAAHTLKGSAAIIGAGRLSELAFALEKLGREGIVEGARDRLAEIEAELARVDAEVRAGAPSAGPRGPTEP